LQNVLKMSLGSGLYFWCFRSFADRLPKKQTSLIRASVEFLQLRVHFCHGCSPYGCQRAAKMSPKTSLTGQRKRVKSIYSVYCKMERDEGGCGQNLRLLSRQGDVHVLKRKKDESK